MKGKKYPEDYGVDSIALDIVETWRTTMYHNECQARAALQVMIIDALKQQDKRTRHACAESILGLERMRHNATFVEIDAACGACVNTRAIKET